MEAGRVGVYRRDIASGLIHCSPATRVLHGVAPGRGPFPQEDWMAVILPEDRERIRAEIDTTLRNRQPRRSFEYRVWRADDNSVRSIEGRTQYEYDPEGHPVRAFGVMIDVTERKLAEARLRESEDHYRHTVELSPLVSWTADQQGAVLEVSTRWQNLTGIPLSRRSSWPVGNTIHPEDHPGVLEAWNCSVRAGEALDVDYRLRGPDGGYVWMRARAAPRRGAGGEIVRWYGTLEDINDRKLAELALQQSEAFTRSVVESSIDCIKVLDIEGRLLFMNAAGLRLNEIHDFRPGCGTKLVPLCCRTRWHSKRGVPLRQRERSVGSVRRLLSSRRCSSQVVGRYCVSYLRCRRSVHPHPFHFTRHHRKALRRAADCQARASGPSHRSGQPSPL